MFKLTKAEKIEALFASFHAQVTEILRFEYQEIGKPSYSELGKKIGKTAQEIQDILEGRINMNLRDISEISYALGRQANLILL